MIVLDTHVLINDALDPARLSRRARAAIAEGQDEDRLACSDMSLWEIALLVARGRVRVDTDPESFLASLIRARSLRVLPITPATAVLAQSDLFLHGDPADRIIAATALAHGAPLVSADAQLRRIRKLKVIW